MCQADGSASGDPVSREDRALQSGAMRKPLTQDEFERAYAKRSDMTIEEFRAHLIGLPCNCTEEGCEGWAAIDRDPYRIDSHLKHSAPDILVWAKRQIEEPSLDGDTSK